MLLNLVKEYKVKNLNNTKMKAKITKQIECSYICIMFSDGFKPKNISHNRTIS